MVGLGVFSNLVFSRIIKLINLIPELSGGDTGNLMVVENLFPKDALLDMLDAF